MAPNLYHYVFNDVVSTGIKINDISFHFLLSFVKAQAVHSFNTAVFHLCNAFKKEIHIYTYTFMHWLLATFNRSLTFHYMNLEHKYLFYHIIYKSDVIWSLPYFMTTIETL